MMDGKDRKFKDTYGKYVVANLIVSSKSQNIKSVFRTSDFEILEETENKLTIKFCHDETTIVKIMNEISRYCVIEDIHMKEAELEDILKDREAFAKAYNLQSKELDPFSGKIVVQKERQKIRCSKSSAISFVTGRNGCYL